MAMRDTTQSDSVERASRDPYDNSLYRWYALGVLVVVYIFNFIDRSILSILNQVVKEALGASDTMMGFLGGPAFAVFYTFVGIPVARLADRSNRRTLLSVCLAVWSLMTAACGLVQSYLQLFFARVGVAVGEAGGSPPSHSMISDMFPANQRATALAIYSLGIPIGTMLGSLSGGWLNAAFDWRTAFMVVGLPGVAMAFVVRFTLAEPVRGAKEEAGSQASQAQPPAGEVFRILWSRRSFRYLSIGAALHSFVGYGVGYWIPAYFIRSHGLTTQEAGLYIFYLGFASIAGTFLGGYLGDVMAKRDLRWYVWLPGLATLVSVPFAAFAYLSQNFQLVFLVYLVPIFLGSYYLGPTFSLTQSLVRPEMRALASSILLFVINLIGLGMGPQVTGILSDVIAARTDLGSDSLRWALVVVLVFNVISTGFYLLSGRTLRQDLARATQRA